MTPTLADINISTDMLTVALAMGGGVIALIGFAWRQTALLATISANLGVVAEEVKDHARRITKLEEQRARCACSRPSPRGAALPDPDAL